MRREHGGGLPYIEGAEVDEKEELEEDVRDLVEEGAMLGSKGWYWSERMWFWDFPITSKLVFVCRSIHSGRAQILYVSWWRGLECFDVAHKTEMLFGLDADLRNHIRGLVSFQVLDRRWFQQCHHGSITVLMLLNSFRNDFRANVVADDFMRPLSNLKDRCHGRNLALCETKPLSLGGLFSDTICRY